MSARPAIPTRRLPPMAAKPRCKGGTMTTTEAKHRTITMI